ncbi:MAG TPA: type VI secretion system tube protein Hcp [Chthonomonadaceae bacterium]|nr:type VI secretion system tube protein Hcp [Chthonomonadaceae bacterium]
MRRNTETYNLMLLLLANFFCVLAAVPSIGQGRPPVGMPEPERDSHYVLIVNSKEIPIQSYEWKAGGGMVNPGTGRKPIPSVGAITIKKDLDTASTKLLNAALSGKVSNVTLVARNKEGKETLRYHMDDAILNAHSMPPGNHGPETFRLIFARINFEQPGGGPAMNPRRPAFNSQMGGRVNLTAVWDPATRKAKLNWTPPSGMIVYQYKVLTCPGERWHESAARLLDTLDKDTVTYTTDANLRSPGATALFRIRVVTNAGERDSLDVRVTRQ